VHQCLRDNRDKLSEACRREETKLQIIESSNTELMPNLARACKARPRSLCAALLATTRSPGWGNQGRWPEGFERCAMRPRACRAHACDPCRRPPAAGPSAGRRAQAERAVHCEGVRPGKARVFNCLLAAAGYADFSGACREQLARGQARRVKDWRLDYDLRMACKEDVPKARRRPPTSGPASHCFLCCRCHCLAWRAQECTQRLARSEGKPLPVLRNKGDSPLRTWARRQVCAAARAGQDKADGGVLQCLVANEKSTSEACARETARAVRNALSFWTPAGPVTAVCDIDVDKHCPSAKPSAERRMGEVRGAPH